MGARSCAELFAKGPDDPRKGCPLEREHQEHGFPAGRRREFSARLSCTQAQAVRINSSSCQVYLGIRKGESIPHIGDLVFTSESPVFTSQELTDFRTTSRTFSVYYPETRPGSDRYTVVVSINGRYEDWKGLSDEQYEAAKNRLIEESITALEKYIPGVTSKIDWRKPPRPGPSSAIPPISAEPRFRHQIRRIEGVVKICLTSSPGSTTPARSESSCPAGWEPSTTASSPPIRSTSLSVA